MSFWSALFGRRGGRRDGAKASDPVEYKGYIIRAAPYKSNGGYQTAGTIEREVDGVRKEHRFVRADSYASYDDAVSSPSTRRGRSSICRASGFSTSKRRHCEASEAIQSGAAVLDCFVAEPASRPATSGRARVGSSQ